MIFSETLHACVRRGARVSPRGCWREGTPAGRTHQGKACRAREDLHGPPQRLLGAIRHRIRLIQNYHLVLARRQRHLLLRERLDAVAHDVDATLVRRVQLEHTLLVGVSEQRAREAQHAGRLASARWARQDQVGHVALLRQHLETSHSLSIAHDVLDLLWTVLLEPLGETRAQTRFSSRGWRRAAGKGSAPAARATAPPCSRPRRRTGRRECARRRACGALSAENWGIARAGLQ